ncbi:MAG: hypothetical protein H7A24_11910 [Leptospiraceae bacterium]|nr:hypothetical protein [Leptospiraceae bacterium]MCP5512578.1 hypothetical protein [Leptospiraceae bacterium]
MELKDGSKHFSYAISLMKEIPFLGRFVGCIFYTAFCQKSGDQAIQFFCDG